MNKFFNWVFSIFSRPKEIVQPTIDDLLPGAKFKHFKGGKYKIITPAKSADDQSDVVVYRSLVDGEAWVRPLFGETGFLEPKDGKVRFWKV